MRETEARVTAPAYREFACRSLRLPRLNLETISSRYADLPWRDDGDGIVPGGPKGRYIWIAALSDGRVVK